jgi:hypothetical protein
MANQSLNNHEYFSVEEINKMLSFYEFDCLLQKNKKRNRLSEMAFGQNPKAMDDFTSMLDAFAKANAERQKGVQTPAVAPMTSEPPIETPAKPAAPAAGPTQPKKQGAARKDAVGGGVAKPTAAAAIKPVLNTKMDPNDPSSPEGREKRAQYGREKGGMLRNLKGQTELDRWNMMVSRGGQIGNQEVSTWAWALKKKLEEFGVKFPQMKDGQLYVLSFAPGASKEHNPRELPEIVVGPNQFKRASKAVWGEDFLGNADTEPEMTRVSDFDRRLKASMIQPSEIEGEEPSVDPEMQEIVQRALQFSKVLFNDKFTHAFVGKPMSVKQLAHELNKIAPMETVADERKRDNALANAPDLAARRNIQRDPMEIAHERAVSEEAIAHMINLDLSLPPEERYGFFQWKRQPKEGPQVTPESVVVVVPPNEMRNDTDNLSTPVAAGGEQPTQGRTAKDLAAQYKAKMTRQQKQPQPPTPRTEGTDWMDICELMEHWGI